MPINIDPAIIESLVQRETQADQMRKRFAPEAAAPAPYSTLNPELSAILGSVADGASTYNFMKRGSGREDNAMLGGAGGPAATGMAAAAPGLIAAIAGRLLKNKLPGELIDSILGNLGASQMGLAGNNMNLTTKSSQARYDDMVSDAMHRKP